MHNITTFLKFSEYLCTLRKKNTKSKVNIYELILYLKILKYVKSSCVNKIIYGIVKISIF